MLASSLREEAQATVSNKPGHRGEREVSRKTIACGNAGCSGGPVVTTLVCFVYFAREAAGAFGARHSPRPLFSERRNGFCKPRAHRAAGSRRLVPWRGMTATGAGSDHRGSTSDRVRRSSKSEGGRRKAEGGRRVRQS